MSPDAYIEMAETEARHWWFTGRRAILTSVIESLGLPAHARILEIGSGTGGNLEMLSRFGSVAAIEMDDTARRIADEKTGGRFDIRAGVCPNEIPFAGQRFDLICMFDVLEHIEDDVATLVAVRGLLADGGKFLMTVPAHPWLWSAHDEFLHHRRRYTPDELRKKLGDAGLNLRRMSFFNTLLFPLAAAARLKDRLLSSPQASGTGIPPAPVNAAFRAIFAAERVLLRRVSLPFGVSLMAVLEAG